MTITHLDDEPLEEGGKEDREDHHDSIRGDDARGDEHEASADSTPGDEHRAQQRRDAEHAERGDINWLRQYGKVYAAMETA